MHACIKWISSYKYKKSYMHALNGFHHMNIKNSYMHACIEWI